LGCSAIGWMEEYPIWDYGQTQIAFSPRITFYGIFLVKFIPDFLPSIFAVKGYSRVENL
jgi:hypothetical protein